MLFRSKTQAEVDYGIAVGRIVLVGCGSRVRRFSSVRFGSQIRLALVYLCRACVVDYRSGIQLRLALEVDSRYVRLVADLERHFLFLSYGARCRL